MRGRDRTEDPAEAAFAGLDQRSVAVAQEHILNALVRSGSSGTGDSGCSHSLSLRVVGNGGRLIEPVRGFLSGPWCAVLSTLAPDGAPRQIVIHYVLAEDHIRLNGHRDRRWVANVRRDPRVALIIHDERDYLHYVSIRGRASLVDEGEQALAEAMRQADRYGEDPAGFVGQPRVSFRVDPDHVHEYR